ncbi:MAG: hypothetical protein NDJ89_05855 [Oligoflexia bacterium]|nr:hypothetical protein [Oligoflexia bacterium]
MRIKSAFIATLALTASLPGWAGNELGNGGDIFYCPNASGAKAILVDLYEAQLGGRKLQLGPPHADYRQKVQAILDRWSSRSPFRTELYRQWLETFESETLFVRAQLPNVSDEGIVVIPRGCEIKQIAVQLADANLGTVYKRYTIDLDLWDLMDSDNRAALVLHELIFREAIANRGNPQSLRVRHLNQIMLSEATMREYFEASINMRSIYRDWDWGGGTVYNGDSEYFPFPEENLKAFTSFNSAWAALPGKRVEARCQRDWWPIRESSGKEKFFEQVFSATLSERCEGKGELTQTPGETLSLDSLVIRAFAPASLRYESNKGIFHWSGLQTSSFEFKDFLHAKADVHLSCRGISTFSKGAAITLESTIPDAQCTLELQDKPDGRARKSTFTWNGLRKLSYEVTSSDRGKLELRVIEFDGGASNVVEALGLGPYWVSCAGKAADGTLTQCQGLPTTLTCRVPVRNSGDWSWKDETVQLKDPTRVGSNGELYLPKGQVIKYESQLFRGPQPVRLKEDTWVEVDWRSSDSGKCWL